MDMTIEMIRYESDYFNYFRVTWINANGEQDYSPLFHTFAEAALFKAIFS